MRAVLFRLDTMLIDATHHLQSVERDSGPRRPLRLSHADQDGSSRSPHDAGVQPRGRRFASPAIRQVLHSLQQAQIAVGALTFRPEATARMLLEAAQLTDLVDSVVTPDKAPQIATNRGLVLHAAALLNTPPAQCLYVGDAPEDIALARAASMPTVGVGYGAHGVEELITAGAETVVLTGAALATALRELAGPNASLHTIRAGEQVETISA